MIKLAAFLGFMFLSSVASASAPYDTPHAPDVGSTFVKIISPYTGPCDYYNLSDRCYDYVDMWYTKKEPIAYWHVWDNSLRLPANQMIELMAKFEKNNPSAEELKRIAVDHLARQRQYPVEVFKNDKRVASISNSQLFLGYILLILGCTIIYVSVVAAMEAHKDINRI